MCAKVVLNISSLCIIVIFCKIRESNARTSKCACARLGKKGWGTERSTKIMKKAGPPRNVGRGGSSRPPGRPTGRGGKKTVASSTTKKEATAKGQC